MMNMFMLEMYVCCFHCVIRGLCICAFLYVWHSYYDACLSSPFQHLISVDVHGAVCPVVFDVLVASSSPVGGMGT